MVLRLQHDGQSCAGPKISAMHLAPILVTFILPYQYK